MKRRKIYIGIIVICIIMLILNIVSVVWSIYNNESVNVSDIISIVVTIILGISTILQADQANELERKRNTPYFVVDTIIKDIDNIDEYVCDDSNIGIDISLFEAPSIYKENKNYALVGVKEEHSVQVEIKLKNVSDTLISSLKVSIRNGNKYEENQYKNPACEMLDSTIKTHCEELYNKLEKENYRDLFSNMYSNFEPGDIQIISLCLKEGTYKPYIFSDTKDITHALFFGIRIDCESIYGEKYSQDIEFGLRLRGKLIGREETSNKYNYKKYENWYVYEMEKVFSIVGDKADRKKK